MEPRLLNSGDSDVDCELNTPASDSRPLKDKNHPFLLIAECIQYLAQCLARSISKLCIEFNWINDTKIFQLLTYMHSLCRHSSFLSAWAHVNVFPLSGTPASSFSGFTPIHFSGLCLPSIFSRISYQHPRETRSRCGSYHSLCLPFPPHLTHYFGMMQVILTPTCL